MNTNTEPVVFLGALQAVLVAVIALLVGFEVVNWTPEQTGLILGVYVAVSGVITALQRSKVTPLS